MFLIVCYFKFGLLRIEKLLFIAYFFKKLAGKDLKRPVAAVEEKITALKFINCEH